MVIFFVTQGVRMLSRGYSSGAKKKVQYPQLPAAMKEKYRPGEMYRYQDSVPSLPVPPLQQTLSKYLLSVEVWFAAWL